jgi:hypothetical protein
MRIYLFSFDNNGKQSVYSSFNFVHIPLQRSMLRSMAEKAMAWTVICCQEEKLYYMPVLI